MGNYVELDKNFTVEKVNDEEFNFYPYTAFKLEGFPWYETDKKLYRLPLDVMSKIEGNIVTLAKSSAGGCIRFKSNTNKIALKVKYERRRHSPGMPQVSDITTAENLKLLKCLCPAVDIFTSPRRAFDEGAFITPCKFLFCNVFFILFLQN